MATPFTRKSNIEPEFNAGLMYAEALAELLQMASIKIIELKTQKHPAIIPEIMAYLKEVWNYTNPYIIKDSDALKKEIDDLYNEEKENPVKNIKDMYGKIQKIDDIKEKLHIHVVNSGLVPSRKKISTNKRLKEAFL